MKSSSPESIAEQEEWSTIESIMLQFETTHKSTCQTDTSTVLHTKSLLDEMSSTMSTELQSSSNEIISKIITSIKNEQDALKKESNELSTQLSLVQELESQRSTLTRNNTTIITKRRELEKQIPIHTTAASQEVAALDEIEYRHIKQLPKIKNELSLHALMTNIKWDYGRVDVLAGEVSIPKKSLHKRFVIDKSSGESEYVIAEKLWEMIEG